MAAERLMVYMRVYLFIESGKKESHQSLVSKKSEPILLFGFFPPLQLYKMRANNMVHMLDRIFQLLRKEKEVCIMCGSGGDCVVKQKIGFNSIVGIQGMSYGCCSNLCAHKMSQLSSIREWHQKKSFVLFQIGI